MMFRRGYKVAVLALVAASVASTSDAFNLKCESNIFSKIHHVGDLILDLRCRRAPVAYVSSGTSMYNEGISIKLYFSTQVVNGDDETSSSSCDNELAISMQSMGYA
jgi:hypothetical protein